MIFLKIKLAYQRWRMGVKYDYMIKKNGHLIFSKEKEMWDEYLRANKRNDKEKEKECKGFLECINWLLEEH